MKPFIGRPRRSIGILLILAAIALNQEFAAWLLTEDWHLTSMRNIAAVWVIQAILAVSGLLLLARPLALTAGRAFVADLALLALVGLGAFGTLRVTGDLQFPSEKKLATQMARMNASETLHLNLGAERLKLVSKDLPNLELPGWQGRDVFTEQVQVVELERGVEPELYKDLHEVGTDIHVWPLHAEKTVAREDLDLLRPFLDTVDYVKGGKFYFVGGDFVGDDFSTWEVRGGFKAFARRIDGGWVKASGNLRIRWHLADDKDPSVTEDFENFGAWSISAILFDKFKTYEASDVLFQEVLDESIDPASLAEARRNRGQEHVVEMVKAQAEGREWTPPHPFFSHAAASESPSVSVVDLNRDGWDDFYTMPRYGPNQFFMNRGDGTFEEISAELGLDFSDHCTVAIFADFDNDDDDDLFLGRSLARSMFLENVDGRFEDHTERMFGANAPFFALTASATDYDNDGLLDLYVGTYAATIMIKDIRARKKAGLDGRLFPEYLPDDQAQRLYQLQMAGTGHQVRDRFGPPNVLLHNAGNGSFEAVDSPLNLYRNTYQAGFADFDGDGDQDVYVANDFSPNNMFRNDDGVFVDVTEETNAADIGFGMGIAWGDFDRDGDQDAYVSNMFSKAGNRILPMVEAVDKTFLRMAGGNSLLELQDGRFERVSSLDGPGYHVEYGGWSWGSQFVDVDNDAWLDLYALSGYYSAPKEIAGGHDL